MTIKNETRVVNAETGGEKGGKLARFDLIPVAPMLAVAEHYGLGAQKYEDRNWERGYAWSLSYAAAQRHLHAFWAGDDIDDESGSPHLAAVVFHCLAMMEWAVTHPELDNRPHRTEPTFTPTDSDRILEAWKRVAHATANMAEAWQS